MILQCILVFQRFSRHYLLYCEWLACDSSHRRSHELATGPAHTSLFSHGWLLVAPHKLPNWRWVESQVKSRYMERYEKSCVVGLYWRVVCVF